MASQRDISQTLSERGIDESTYRMLVDHGRRRGRISRDEVVDIIPDTEFDEPLIEQFIEAISNEGIAVEDVPLVTVDMVNPEAPLYEENEEPVAEGEDFIEPNYGNIDLSGIEVDDVLRMYLREAAQTPLLTASEEVELARRIEMCRMAYEELSRGGLPTNRQKELQRIIEEGRIAREHLIRANTRLVISVARRYSGHGLPITDLIQEGNIGLMRAIRNFDYRRGFKFSTYATWWIRQAISRALADQSRTIRLPAYISDQIGRMRRTQTELQQRLGRAPTNDELAAAMEMPVSRIEQMIESNAQPVSLEAPVSEDQEAELGDLLEDINAPNPEEAVEDTMETEEMRRRLEELPAREREIIRLRFGLGDEEPLTLAEIGERLGITRERARQIEIQAIQRMRNPQSAQRKRRGV
jgi:RNA polymerase primary sigma factor